MKAEVKLVKEKHVHKELILFLKIIPMLLALCALVNTALEFVGINAEVLSAIGGISFLPLAFLYLASYAFHFCRYHRMFLHYVLINNLITWFDYLVGIPVSTLAILCFHVVIAGLFLFLILYFHKKERCCN